MEAKATTLLLHQSEHVRALREGSEVYERRFQLKVADGVRDFLTGPEVSADFRERWNSSPAPDPWKDGFAVLRVADNTVVGLCGFADAPTKDGMVEIAYGIAPDYRALGYATEAAQALVARAAASELVRTIRAHTLPQHNASTRVLEKCGFALIGEVIHPEDGLVWRWEFALQVA